MSKKKAKDSTVSNTSSTIPSKPKRVLGVTHFTIQERVRMVQLALTYEAGYQRQSAWKKEFGRKYRAPSYQAFEEVLTKFERTGTVANIKWDRSKRGANMNPKVIAQRMMELVKKYPERTFKSIAAELGCTELYLQNVRTRLLSKPKRAIHWKEIHAMKERIQELRHKLARLEGRRMIGLKRYKRIPRPRNIPSDQIPVPSTSMKSVKAKIAQFTYPWEMAKQTMEAKQSGVNKENTGPEFLYESDSDSDTDTDSDENTPAVLPIKPTLKTKPKGVQLFKRVMEGQESADDEEEAKSSETARASEPLPSFLFDSDDEANIETVNLEPETGVDQSHESEREVTFTIDSEDEDFHRTEESEDDIEVDPLSDLRRVQNSESEDSEFEVPENERIPEVNPADDSEESEEEDDSDEEFVP